MSTFSKIGDAYREFRDTPSGLPPIGIPSPEADHRAIADYTQYYYPGYQNQASF